MTVAEISNHFTWEKYSVGLTAENNKITDKSSGSFGTVTDIYVHFCFRKQEPMPLSPFPMLSWHHIWQDHTMFSPVALGSPNSLQKGGVMTKSPSGPLVRGVSTGRCTCKEAPCYHSPCPRSLEHIQEAFLQPQAASQFISHHKIQGLCWKSWQQWHLLNAAWPSLNSAGSVTTSVTPHQLLHMPCSFFQSLQGLVALCNFWPLSFLFISQFLKSPIFVQEQKSDYRSKKNPESLRLSVCVRAQVQTKPQVWVRA